MTTIALSSSAASNDTLAAGQLIYRQMLFSSRKATNTLLTLLKEAVVLPLPCSNVIHKVRFWFLFLAADCWVEKREMGGGLFFENG